MSDQPSPYDPGSKPPAKPRPMLLRFPPSFPSGIDWQYTRQAAIDRINSQPDPLVADLVAIIDGMVKQPPITKL